MPLDPQVIQVMESVAALGLPAAHTVSPEEARANGKKRPRSPGPEVAKVEDRNATAMSPFASILPKATAHSRSWSGTTVAAGLLATLNRPTDRAATCAWAASVWSYR